MDMGEIYCVTSPSGKQYVGQCVKLLSNGKPWGTANRWRDHVRDAERKNYCRSLCRAINKYGADKFIVEVLIECHISELNDYEIFYIEELNTLSPNGYNLTEGGRSCRQSEETKMKKSESLKGKNKGRNMEKRTRLRKEDNHLPKYIRHYRDSYGKEGYRISSHPYIKSKSFLTKSLTMEEKLQLACQYLEDSTIES